MSTLNMATQKMATLKIALQHGELNKLNSLFRSPYNKEHSILGSVLGPLSIFGSSHIDCGSFGC